MGYAPLQNSVESPRRPTRWWLHVSLFLLTGVTTTMAGVAWSQHDPFMIENWGYGVLYSFLLLLFLSAHEFGHYFAARYHGVHTSLPYFIPIPSVLGMPFGTMGAVIRIRSPLTSRKALFDIAVAGPLAGFVVCLGILAVGIFTLPPIEYLYTIHPEYRLAGLNTSGLHFGDTLLFSGIRAMVASTGKFFPPMNEIYHYPFLCVGWFGMFVTALNMMPVGQLDGGHIVYAMFGRIQHLAGRIFWTLLLVSGLFGLLDVAAAIAAEPSPDSFLIWLRYNFNPIVDTVRAAMPWLFAAGVGWLFWAILIRFLIGIKHPVIDDTQPLSTVRNVLGWIALIIFVLSFSPNPVSFVP